MKSCTEPTAYGVERFAPNFAAATIPWKAAIFHDAVACSPHWRWTWSICVASYTPATSTFPWSTTSASDSHVDEIRPESATTGFCQSSSKFCVNVAATLGDATVKITFSSRFHESLVQFADPVSTAAAGVPASRTTYL